MLPFGATSAAAPRVVVTTRGGPFPGAAAPVLERRALKMLRALELPAVELSIALVDDARIRELNRVHRRKDKPTDVLSFPLHEPFAALRSGDLLGDVVLSIDTARRQASKRRRPLLDELTMLLAHGILHLLGHDHRTDREEREMTARTRELERVAAARGGPPSSLARRHRLGTPKPARRR